MSNSTVSSVNSAALPNVGHRLEGVQNTRRSHGGDDDGEGGSQGLNLFSALLQALVSAASQAKAGSATTSTTATTGATATSAASATTATTPSRPSTAGTSLSQDLGAFLHDLFRALRQAGRQESEGRHLEPLSPSTSAAAQTSSTASTASTATTATTGITATTGTAAATGATASSGSTPSISGNSGLSGYRDHGLIGALQQLIQELGNSQAVSTASTDTPSLAVSQNVLSHLNSAFQRLIADLGGTSAASGSQSDTTALKSFLQGFLQDLQNGGASGASGNLLNASA